jgi:hypothetical protein
MKLIKGPGVNFVLFAYASVEEQLIDPINHGSNYQQNVNPGMFYSSDRSSHNFMGNLGSIGGVQVCESPASQLGQVVLSVPP